MNHNDSVRVRFAPSPTGGLHIGGARTALFNYMYAKNMGGKFLLRIEDTDKERSTDEATKTILDGLNWLGLTYDESIVYQSKNIDRHKEIANILLKNGHAYKCFATQEELAEMKLEAEKNKRPPRYDRRWRDVPDIKHPDKPYVLRLKAPLTGTTVIDDLVQGSVTMNNSELDDLVLLRQDGTPTYNLAVVVDDHDMGITHVIRGDDHLSNAFRQSVIFKAMDWKLPYYAHIPLIHGPDGKKLSKRHGATIVSEYAGMGIIPAAMNNFLSRMGWSHGEMELFTILEAIPVFSLEAIGRGPARFDDKRLSHINHYHIGKLSSDDIVSVVMHSVKYNGDDTIFFPDSIIRLRDAIPMVQPRSRTTGELINMVKPFIMHDITYTEDANNFLVKFGNDNWSNIINDISNSTNWNLDSIESTLRNISENHAIKFNLLGQALRAILTGSLVNGPVNQIMFLLGKDIVNKRIIDYSKV